MTYISFSFLLFFTITAFIYFLVPSKLQYIVLLISSYLFYFWANSGLPIYMVITTVIIFVGTNIMSKIDSKTKALISEDKSITKEKKKELKAKAKSQKKWLLVLMICVNLLLLSVFKYTQPLLNVFGAELKLNLIFPLGISFYTFQSLGYAIDVFRGKVQAEKNFLKTALFVSYFPQIVEGPIGRFNTLAPQLFSEHRFSFERFQRGFLLTLWGFLKKVVLADSLFLLTGTLSTDFNSYDGFQIFVGIMLYGIQLYADFSGCMDIAMGFSNILGIQLDYNFRQPYFSTSVAEFWRRWHISLCQWFKDYLFYSIFMSKPSMNLSKSLRAKGKKTLATKIPTCVAMAIVWFLTGLWHTANIPYILWGISNGVIMMFSLLFAEKYKKINSVCHINENSKVWRFIRIIRTYLLMTVLNFMSEFKSMSSFGECLLSVIKNPVPHGFSPSYFIPALMEKGIYAVAIIVVVCLAQLFYSLYEENHGSGSLIKAICSKHWIVRSAVAIAVSMIIILMAQNSADFSGGFMYAQF